MNNQATACTIIANIWLVGAWLVDGMFAWFLMILMSLIWMAMSVKITSDQIRSLRRKQMIQDLEDQFNFMKRMHENQKPKRRSRKK